MNTTAPFNPASITRPDKALLTYYMLVAGLTLILFPIALLPLYFKFRTLRYQFDDKGVSMSWGMFYKRETYLTYRRIQDIHVTRNLFHRWLGLASVGIQTASGTSGAEMTIEGVRNPEALRDYLYSQMRGAQDDAEVSTPESDSTSMNDEALELLRGVLAEVKRLRTAMEQRS